MKILFTVLGLFSSINAYSAVCSRTITFSDGSVLTAAQLNDEFNAAINCINGIDNSNIASGAAISPSKLASSIAGDGLTRNVTTGVLSVNTDNSTTELSSGAIRIKDAGVSTAKLATNSVTTVKITDANVTAAKLATDSVTTAKIADDAVTQAKLGASNIQVSSTFSFSTTSLSYGDVSGATVTITTSGRPVYIQMITGITDAVGSSTELFQCYIKILRDGSSIAGYRTSATTSDAQMATTINHIDQPAAGTYTYKIQARWTGVGSACIAVGSNNIKLLAYEL